MPQPSSPPATVTPSVAPTLQLSLPLRPCRALRYQRHAHAPTPSSCRRWLPTPLDSAKSCLPYTSVWPYGHEATTNPRRITVGSSIRALARKSYRILTARATAHLARNSLRLITHSRCANAKILLAYFLHLHPSRVLGCAWATRLTLMGVRERFATRKAIGLACPVVGGSSALGFVHVRLGTIRWSSVSVSSSYSTAAATAAIVAAMSVRARLAGGQVASPEPRSSSLRVRSSTSLSPERERQGTQLQSASSFGSQGSRQQQQQQEKTPPPPGDLSTAPPTSVSRTTDSGGDGDQERGCW